MIMTYLEYHMYHVLPPDYSVFEFFIDLNVCALCTLYNAEIFIMTYVHIKQMYICRVLMTKHVYFKNEHVFNGKNINVGGEIILIVLFYDIHENEHVQRKNINVGVK